MEDMNGAKAVNRVPTVVAAKLMGLSEDTVRWGLRQERFPVGFAVKKDHNSQWNYYISPLLLANFVGVDVAVVRRETERFRERVRRIGHGNMALE